MVVRLSQGKGIIKELGGIWPACLSVCHFGGWVLLALGDLASLGPFEILRLTYFLKLYIECIANEFIYYLLSV